MTILRYSWPFRERKSAFLYITGLLLNLFLQFGSSISFALSPNAMGHHHVDLLNYLQTKMGERCLLGFKFFRGLTALWSNYKQ
jgi:hypothetical protein